jgi:hypothetical protein
MPIRQFLLLKLSKNLGYAYRARSVEAIRLCRNLEQDLLATYGTVGVHNVHTLQPATVQSAKFLQSENIRERLGISTFAAVYMLTPFSILGAVWDAVQEACSKPGKNHAADTAFDRLFDLLRRHSNEKFNPSIVECVIAPFRIRGSFSDLVQPRISQTER